MLVLYYILLAGAVLEMLRRDVNPILLTFSFLALIPAPPTLVLGILMIVIWSKHKTGLPVAS